MIYCVKCHWSQDDFWVVGFTSAGPGYTPLRHDIVEFLRNRLFEDRCYFDRPFFEENKLNPDGQDERGFGSRVRNMLLGTSEDGLIGSNERFIEPMRNGIILRTSGSVLSVTGRFA